MTPAEIAALSPEARTQLFRSLAEERYGTVKTMDLCAEEMGYSRRAAFGWVSENCVPLPVLYSLSAWSEVQALANTIRYLSPRP